MPCFKRKFFAVFAVAVMMFALVPSVGFAARSCECFCGAVGVGAIDADAMSADKCLETCRDTNTRFIGCFTDPAQYPGENDKCWTRSECESWSGTRGGTVITATWGDEFPADCAKTKTSGDEMHYCYAKDVPYTLNIAIGDIGEIQNLGDYINIVYTWLLPAASLIAVVMMMLGGLQYVLARGKSKYIDKAKERITNAITGIVILLSIFVILNLIDPRLTSFDSLKVPLIKEVTILDSASSCERLADYGYEITPLREETCGNKGKITDNSGLKDNALGSWKVDDLCDYTHCTKSGETCLSDGSCASCDNIPTPTVTTCGQLEKLGSKDDEQIYCRYNSEKNSCMSVTPISGINSFNCPSLRALAKGNKDNPACEYYETLLIKIDDETQFITSEDGADLLNEICSKDPCGLAANSGASRCSYNTGLDSVDFWGVTWSTSPGYYCHTY